MKNLSKTNKQKLNERKKNNALRQLGVQKEIVDFSSNDYLGFSKNETIFNSTHHYLIDNNLIQNGATGSRLLTGNHPLYALVENQLCEFHNSDAALVFNSGYDANIGFFSSVPQRNDVILYDEFIHASIRDGISMSHAKAYKFKHNNLEDLNEMLKRVQHDSKEIYIVSESVFSMDGDSPDLVALSQLCEKHSAYLIIDEAHAVGVFGNHGCGLVQELGLEASVFARLVTFGKALGCHGAAILGSKELKHYLINFARSFIYTTALSPHALVTINFAYQELKKSNSKDLLKGNINCFKKELTRLQLNSKFLESNSAIHCCIVSGNEKVKSVAVQIQNNGFDVKPILSPTVPVGEERLRFCLHSCNSREDITEVLELLATFV